MTVDVFSAKKVERQVRIDPNATAVIVIDMLNESASRVARWSCPGTRHWSRRRGP